MTDPTTAREALIAEVIGDLAKLLGQAEALAPMLDEACRSLLQADEQLRKTLADFECRMATITESAKIRAMQHLALQIDKAATQSVQLQAQAMSRAARTAFDHALGDTLQHLLRRHLGPKVSSPPRHSFEPWLTHLATLAAGSVLTWILALHRGCV